MVVGSIRLQICILLSFLIGLSSFDIRWLNGNLFKWYIRRFSSIDEPLLEFAHCPNISAVTPNSGHFRNLSDSMYAFIFGRSWNEENINN